MKTLNHSVANAGKGQNQYGKTERTNVYENEYTSLGNNIAMQTDIHDRKDPNRDSSAPSVYNLIILDESGSMSFVRSQTVKGCNEVLQGIRLTATEEDAPRQYVSIFCFDTSNSRYLLENVPIEQVKNLTECDYSPSGATPLYDAIGYTVTRLKEVADTSDSTGKVTIITDGMENASQKWNKRSIAHLIDELKKKGWLFTFIGANIDVESTSVSLHIDSYIEFKQTDEGMHEMFDCERRSQQAYSRRMSRMRRSQQYMDAGEEERSRMLASMNANYFTSDRRVAPDFIKHLHDDEVFVFGSNPYGKHMGGASGFAVQHFGAVQGQGEGAQGRCYAIPSDRVSLSDFESAVNCFTEYVALHPEKKFMMSAIGCGNAGGDLHVIAPLFRHAYSFGNLYVPASFLPFVEERR